MISCKDAERMILSGEYGSELAAHLEVCRDCSSLRKDLAEIRELCGKNLQDDSLRQIPESLELSIKAAARTALSAEKGARRGTSRRFALWISSMAAVFAAALGIALYNNGLSDTARTSNKIVSAREFPVNKGNAFAMDSSADFYTEVAELSLDLEYSINGNTLDYNDMILSQLSSDGRFFTSYY